MVTGKFYKNVVLRKLKNYHKSRGPKTELKYIRLLHDNAPAHKARIVTDFWCQRRLPSFRTLRIRQTCPPSPLRLFSLSRYNSRNSRGSVVYQCLVGVPIEEYKKWIDRLKWYVLTGGEYFEGQSKLK